MSMPMILANRSLIIAIYHAETSDGFKAIFTSSQGNEAQTEACAEKIGSDVVGNNIVNFLAYKPFDGGIELKNVMAMDPAGMIPGFVKGRIGGRMANVLMLIVDYLRDGVVAEPLF